VDAYAAVRSRNGAEEIDRPRNRGTGQAAFPWASRSAGVASYGKRSRNDYGICARESSRQSGSREDGRSAPFRYLSRGWPQFWTSPDGSLLTPGRDQFWKAYPLNRRAGGIYAVKIAMRAYFSIDFVFIRILDSNTRPSEVSTIACTREVLTEILRGSSSQEHPRWIGRAEATAGLAANEQSAR